MQKTMKFTTIFLFAASVVVFVLNFFFNKEIYLILTITFGTTFYHFAIRLSVGLIYSIVMNNRADYTKSRYRVNLWEVKLYGLLRVKKWKSKIPTYNPNDFSTQKHSLREIVQVTCQSESVHETNIVLSFIPLIASRFFGSFYVFFITSLCSAISDLMFVIVQRYNRYRLMKIISR